MSLIIAAAMLTTLLIAAGVAAAPMEQPAPLDAAPRATGRAVRLTPGQLFRLAEQAEVRGDSKTAARFLAVLAENPDADIRAQARYRRAKQLLGQGQPQPAAVLLRAILDEKPGATNVRLHLAQLRQQLGDADGALRELRSAQAAGLPPHVARIVDRYSESIRARRPSGFNFEIALAPDSNINRATRSDTLGTVIG
ncbi:MAG TPA: tetratricopeptide repeat protein, partial [Sphingomicrobium sp.]|nr:tetratricopeptide repeat protein [Sphingomicrobium sp.]